MTTFIRNPFRRRSISPRRARALAEAARLARMVAELDAENARREAELNRPCPHCAAMDQPQQDRGDRAVTTDGLTPDDDACLRMLAGANFGPQSSITLPSGRRLAADEAQALTSFYAPPAGSLSSERDESA